MTGTEQFFHDYEHAEPDKRDALLREFLLKRIEPKSLLAIGVWINNTDFYRYRGKLPIVVEHEPPLRPTQYTALSGCISCQLAKITGKAKRWLILPQ